MIILHHNLVRRCIEPLVVLREINASICLRPSQKDMDTTEGVHDGQRGIQLAMYEDKRTAVPATC